MSVAGARRDGRLYVHGDTTEKRASHVVHVDAELWGDANRDDERLVAQDGRRISPRLLVDLLPQRVIVRGPARTEVRDVHAGESTRARRVRLQLHNARVVTQE